MLCFAKLVRRVHAVQIEFRALGAINCWLNVDLFEKKVSSIPSIFGKVTVSWFGCELIVRRDHVVQDGLRGVAAINCWLNVDLFEKKVSSIPCSFGKVTVS